MIKLMDLLLEVSARPKAIFLAGPAGSGKTYISKQLIPSNLTVINVDDTYEVSDRTVTANACALSVR